ncbi:putative translation initiation factor eIF-2B alpha subunit [Eremomyces bilateralis CBS 781.70]|uniref:Translation initiation factor eIF2B subunit alpha n=1 Tax=Eremomyces bilateralis CBS 781.70 TaxID=1392243 RepID=A0A6G1FX48_9PEZI|nr:putative translation initiation factor eIF-2B alpha subunit [Eremomyces bilateralis CBS 781.70]KAF1810363.1 putative translation initiation factor eIF-2B alpha subunit [Eremomyces bilateralis CBS 781.70]
MTSTTPTQPSPLHNSRSPSEPFDIVTTYHHLLSADPDLTMPVAAIESLVLALSSTPTLTISETLALLSTHVATLKSAIPNPISLSAGTDLFQRYLISSLQRPSSPDGDFESVRRHLLTNGRLFVERAKQAREEIANFGRHFVRDGKTVLTNGGSRVVGSLLQSAAEASAGSVRFRVIYVLDSDNLHACTAAEHEHRGRAKRLEAEGTATVAGLRKRGVPVATIPSSAVGYAMGEVDMVIVGAEGVVENGGIISRLGTYQMGLLAKSAGKPFYVVAESHKFVRLYPLSQFDLPIEQDVLRFVADETSGKSGKGVEFTDEAIDVEDGKAMKKNSIADSVDFTPPNLISGIITEGGVLTPSAVSEELIKIWF